MYFMEKIMNDLNNYAINSSELGVSEELSLEELEYISGGCQGGTQAGNQYGVNVNVSGDVETQVGAKVDTKTGNVSFGNRVRSRISRFFR
jgi:hypothetical protein